MMAEPLQLNMSNLEPTIKQEDGYSIENQQSGQLVNITANQPYANITIHMTPKGGVLLGAVKDAVTGKPIEHPNVQYIALDGEAAGGGLGDRGNGQFRVVVPAATDVVLIVQARGYKGWIYIDPNNPSRPVLRLRLDQFLGFGSQPEKSVDPFTDQIKGT